ncbi:hypothetical protein PR202_gn00642 [Eleusine coracana subsp. coracana]|uniref:Uncharacterized protein n=1 Tax=Eleusine coracana subsp. coracana TaxID=191504 RepID=A0AAV5G2C2_ELECO|nr:hypothetical protein PR202_gn00642 [Eleusine coracana subsp. coracana]
MSDGAGCGVRRVVRPERRYMPSREEQDKTWSRLLSKMDAFYTEASNRLTLSARPVTLARFLDAGICIGLLDPVSNIIANTITSDLRPDYREKVLVATAVETKLGELGLGRRSLDGLVAFLVYFFPYLAKWEAVRYLLLADADLLAAACLIVADRGMGRFSLGSPVAAPAFEEALTLAAQVAKHSQPKQLAQVWMMLSPRPNRVLHLLLYKVQPHSPRQNLDEVTELIQKCVVPDLAASWDFAASRLRSSSSIASMPYQHTRSLRMVLLDTIHGFYLKALAILPRSELRSRLHRSLLKAGYCYGPLDPLSNIILNTIWYDINFPAAETPVLDVIGPKSLTRLESRSFYGLVSFLQTRYNDLSEHQIVGCLVASSAQLSIADPKLLSDVTTSKFDQPHYWQCLECIPSIYGDVIRKMQQSPCADVQEAYAAAATAAWHPNPEEQAKFLASWDERVFARSPFYLPKEVGRHLASVLVAIWAKQWWRTVGIHGAFVTKPALDLHIICCVNEEVCGPEYCEEIDDPLSFAPFKYRYSHINFMATERDCKFDVIPCPVLFFAEFDNEEEDGAPLFLCKVHEPTPFAEHVRCLYCEAAGARIVHPPSPKFHGGGNELEEVIRGEHSLSNDELICMNEHAVQHMCGVEEDFMYVDVN